MEARRRHRAWHDPAVDRCAPRQCLTRARISTRSSATRLKPRSLRLRYSPVPADRGRWLTAPGQALAARLRRQAVRSPVSATSTNKAAAEMKTRALGTAIVASDRIEAGTLHGFGVRFLRSHGEQLGIAPDFEIIDPEGGEGSPPVPSPPPRGSRTVWPRGSTRASAAWHPTTEPRAPSAPYTRRLSASKGSSTSTTSWWRPGPSSPRPSPSPPSTARASSTSSSTSSRTHKRRSVPDRQRARAACGEHQRVRRRRPGHLPLCGRRVREHSPFRR